LPDPKHHGKSSQIRGESIKELLACRHVVRGSPSVWHHRILGGQIFAVRCVSLSRRGRVVRCPYPNLSAESRSSSTGTRDTPR
jgi:hypothetical protein